MAEQEIKIPDIGVDGAVDVIEVSVKPGDSIDVDTPLVTLESEKASMDVPATVAGVVKSVAIKTGDKVSTGDVILILETATADAKADEPEIEKTVEQEVSKTHLTPSAPIPKTAVEAPTHESDRIGASPVVRRLARELDIDLQQITGTGRKGRIQKQDLQGYIKRAMRQSGSSGIGAGLPAVPQIDHAAFGDIEFKPLAKIRRFSGSNLHRNWLQVPHITQFDEADITELEAFRKSKKVESEKLGFKLTPLVFIMKAVVAALREFPEMNSSLDSSGEQLILKKYYHLGVAVDTPNGLVVPVIRDVDQKGMYQLAEELALVSEQARTKGLMPAQMQGSCFTISSLGGIGGTAFTPIVNMPDVAILGVSRSSIKPIYQAGEFVPRLMLPLSLSYDHRVIDGAQGARFITYLSNMLADIRNLLL